MKNIILTFLVALNSSDFWVKEFTKFLERADTKQLREESGSYTAANLLAELKIRIKSVEKAGIKTIGMIELASAVSTHNADFKIKNFAFESPSYLGIAYMDNDETTVIGVILIQRNKGIKE